MRSHVMHTLLLSFVHLPLALPRKELHHLLGLWFDCCNLWPMLDAKSQVLGNLYLHLTSILSWSFFSFHVISFSSFGRSMSLFVIRNGRITDDCVIPRQLRRTSSTFVREIIAEASTKLSVRWLLQQWIATFLWNTSTKSSYSTSPQVDLSNKSTVSSADAMNQSNSLFSLTNGSRGFLLGRNAWESAEPCEI